MDEGEADLFASPAPRPPHSRTRVLLPTGERLIAHFDVVALTRVLTSHEPYGTTLRRQNDYPPRVQFREYAGTRGEPATQVVYDAAQQIDPDQLLDPTRTTVAGPPLVAPWPLPGKPDVLVCVAGNQRCMLLATAKHVGTEPAQGGLDAYVAALRLRVAELQLDPAHIEAALSVGDVPVLVRVLERWDRSQSATGDGSFPADRSARAAEFGRINRASDSSFTKARDLTSLAHSLAADVRNIEEDGPETGSLERQTPLAHLVETLQEVSSLSRYFASNDGQDCFALLLRHRAIPGADKASYLNPHTERLSQSGRAVLEAMIGALVFEDPLIEDVAPRTLLRALWRSLPDLLACSQCVSARADWNLALLLGDALRLLGKYEASIKPPGARGEHRVRPSPRAFRTWIAQRAAALDVHADSAASPSGKELKVASGAQRPASAAVPTAEQREDVLPAADTATLAHFLAEHGERGDVVAAAIASWTHAARRAGAITTAKQLSFNLGDRRKMRRIRPGRPSKSTHSFPSPRGDESPADAFRRIFRSKAASDELWTALTREHVLRSKAAHHLPDRVASDRVASDRSTRATHELGAQGDKQPAVSEADGSNVGTDIHRARGFADEGAIYEQARKVWREWHAERSASNTAAPDQRALNATPHAARGKPRAFGDDEVFATYVVAECRGLPLTAVAGRQEQQPPIRRPDARTCRRRMAPYWEDPGTRPLLILHLKRTAAHRRARPTQPTKRKRAPRSPK